MEQRTERTEIPAVQLKNVINPWLLGADPEFAVFTPPRRVHNQGEYACQFTDAAGAVGHDHGGRVWELRPAPAQSACQLVTNIWQLLRAQQMSPVEKFKWKGGGVADSDDEADTLGGHVHFGFRNWNPGQLEALSNVTRMLERLDILPAREGPLRRDMHPDYGNLMGQRTSGGHVEYRAPASWLDKPGQALAVLGTFKLAALRPESTNWRPAHVKADYLSWLDAMPDADTFITLQIINKLGFAKVQADPETNFRPLWREKGTQRDLLLV